MRESKNLGPKNGIIDNVEGMSLDEVWKNIKKIDWDHISEYHPLSDEFIDEFNEYVNWELISENQDLSEEFIEKFKDMVDWYMLSFKEMTEDFMRKMKDYINWEVVSEYQTLSEDFIEENWDNLYIELVLINQILSEEFIKKHECDGNYWKAVSGYQKMSLKFILDNLRKIDNFALGYNNKISEETKDYLKKIGVI